MEHGGNGERAEVTSISARQISNLIYKELSTCEEFKEIDVPEDWWEYFEDFCYEFNYKIGAKIVYPYREKSINGQKLASIKEKFKDYLRQSRRQDILRSYRSIEFEVCLSVQKLVFKEHIQRLNMWLKTFKKGDVWCLGMLLEEDPALFRSFNSLYVTLRDRFPRKKLDHEILMNALLSVKVLERNLYQDSGMGQHRYKKKKSAS